MFDKCFSPCMFIFDTHWIDILLRDVIKGCHANTKMLDACITLNYVVPPRSMYSWVINNFICCSVLDSHIFLWLRKQKEVDKIIYFSFILINVNIQLWLTECSCQALEFWHIVNKRKWHKWLGNDCKILTCTLGKIKQKNERILLVMQYWPESPVDLWITLSHLVLNRTKKKKRKNQQQQKTNL